MHRFVPASNGGGGDRAPATGLLISVPKSTCLCLLLWYKSVSVGLWARLARLARLQQHGWIHLLLPALCVAERIRPEPGVGTAVACGKCMAMHSHLHCVVWVRALLEPCSARACNAPTLAVAVGAGGRFCQADLTSL